MNHRMVQVNDKRGLITGDHAFREMLDRGFAYVEDNLTVDGNNLENGKRVKI